MSNKIKILSFILYAAIIIIAFFSRPLVLKTDIMDIVPKSDNSNQIAEDALNNLSKEYTSKINVLFSNTDFKQSKDAGLYFSYLLKDLDLQTQFVIEQDQEQILNLISQYNYHLLSDKARRSLQNDNYTKVVQNSLSLLYSPFKAGVLPFNNDPFLLVPDFMLNLGLIKSSFVPQDGVLSAKLDNQTYAYMLISLAKDKAFSPSYLLPIVKKINQAKEKTLQQYPDVKIHISGVPMHSYKATSNSINEINFITIVSIAVILLLSYLMFRSLNCFAYALFTIGISFGLAFCTTVIAFGYTHVLVLLFGSSLIGLCINYHLHYFIERAHTKEALPKIRKAINLSIIIGIGGFSVMLLSGIALIVHMAFFAIIGLLNSYIIIIVLYPLLMQNIKIKKTPNYINKFEKKLASMVHNFFKEHLYLKLSLVVLFFGVGIFMLQPTDSIKDLYKPDAKLLQAEILFGKITNMGSAPVMMVASGSTQQQVLEQEETARQFLDGQKKSKNISGYKSLTQIVPSQKRQTENYELVENLFTKELGTYLHNLGIQYNPELNQHLQSQKNKFISLNDLWNYKIFSALKGFYIEDNNKYASVILIENAKDKQILKTYATANNLLFSDKLEELSTILKHTRQQASTMVFIIAILIFAALVFAYKNLKDSIILTAPSILSVIATLGILGFTGINISLFHVLALFIVLCCGIDYAIFRSETKGKIVVEGVAVMLTWITAMASFGALAFTSFAVTKALGITLCLGLSLSYLFSPIATLKQH